MLTAKDARNLMAPDANAQVESLNDDITVQATGGISFIDLTGTFWGAGPTGQFPKVWNDAVGIFTRLGYIVNYDKTAQKTTVNW